jgi:hypothetical protein
MSINFLLRRSIRVLVFTAFVTACGKAEDKITTTAPVVPPAETLSISVDSLKSSDDSANLVGTNHTTAYITVSLTALVTSAVLAVPYAAVTAALKQTASKQADGTFKWSFDFNAANADYQTGLIGKRGAGETGGTGASFEFYVTRTPADAAGCCTGFQWLNGSYASSTNVGSWIVNDHESPTNLSALRTVDWNYPSETSKTLTITHKRDDEEWKAGGFVEWVESDSTRKMTIDKNPSDETKIVVNWDATTKAGSMVKESGETVCWDTAFANVECP